MSAVSVNERGRAGLGWLIIVTVVLTSAAIVWGYVAFVIWALGGAS